MDSTETLIACVLKLGGEDLELTPEGEVDFTFGGVAAFAYVNEGNCLRGSAWISDLGDTRSQRDAEDWITQQTDPSAGHLELVDAADATGHDGDYRVRVLFERPLDPERIDESDQLAGEVIDLFLSWVDPREEDTPAPELPVAFVPEDPTYLAPESAWLLVGDDSSWFDVQELQQARTLALKGIYEQTWTAAKQTQPGDLLLWYFSTPRTAIHFVARAVDTAHFLDVGDNGQRWAGRQWWVHHSPPVEIAPINLETLRGITGEMVMRGRSGRYLRPEHVARLAELARPADSGDSAELLAVLQPVTGKADLPNPQSTTLAQWCEIAAGAMPLEAHVERHVVEPLLTFLTTGHAGMTVSKAFRVGNRIADYAVLEPRGPIFVVEAKLRIRTAPNRPWVESKDFAQASDYGSRLGVPALLVDAIDIHLIPVGADEPSRSWVRRDFSERDLSSLREALGL